jgi:hypothetical protein
MPAQTPPSLKTGALMGYKQGYTPRPSPYTELLEQPVELRYQSVDGAKLSYGRCVCKNDVLNAWIDLALMPGVDVDSITVCPSRQEVAAVGAAPK